MKHALLLVLLALASIAYASEQPKPASAKKGRQYGAGVPASAAPVALADALKQQMFSKTITIVGKVKEVCSVKGCWMILNDGGTKVRVTFKDYGFFMPRNLVGKKIVATGVLSVETVSQADARHYAEDAGKSKKEIEKIIGDQQEFNFESTGVRVL
jgi:hypothetical protein